MDTVSFHQFLVVYIWFPLAALLFFLLLIGRFYQKFSGKPTFYWHFLIPIVLFGFAAVRAANTGRMIGDAWLDMALALAGFSLLGLSLALYWRMVVEK